MLQSGKYKGKTFQEVNEADPRYIGRLLLSNVVKEQQNEINRLHDTLKRKETELRRTKDMVMTVSFLRKRMFQHIMTCNNSSCPIPGCAAIFELEDLEERFESSSKENSRLACQLLEKDEIIEKKKLLIQELKTNVIDDQTLKASMIRHIRDCADINCDVTGCMAQKNYFLQCQEKKETQISSPDSRTQTPMGTNCCVCQVTSSSVAYMHGQTAHLCLCEDCLTGYEKVFGSVCPFCQHKDCAVIHVY
jgi:hypothetical protein